MDTRTNTAAHRLSSSRRDRCTTLAIAVAGGEPPSEFRIFTAGVVDTVKGKFTFDETSAASVMAEYAAHGIDLMIDYDHASLDIGVDPSLSGRAAGWFNLEVRGGELWAVNVRWTPPAAEALRRKEWRFMSPAFQTEGSRIVAVMNVAITNLPATRRLEPLMAASITALGASMLSAEIVKEALDALQSGDEGKAMELLKGIVAEAASGEPADAPAAEEPVVEPLAVEAPVEEEQAAIMAATSRLTRITGQNTLGGAVDEVELWRASHLKIEAETKRLAKERETLELSKRKENAATLVKLGAETPHTSGLATNKIAKRLLDEPLDEQNKRVAALLAARGGKLPTVTAPVVPVTDPTGSTPPVDGELEVVTDLGVYKMSASEVRACASVKAKPEDYARNKLIQLKAQSAKRGSKE